MKASCIGFCFASFLMVFASPAQSAPEYKQQTAQEVRAREGVGNFMQKLKDGKPVTVAYLGGSITAQNGWRVKTTNWLQQQYPAAKITPIHAAIGGTGSNLGVFRLGHDVLRHKPDLLFVEFATNDGGAAPNSIWQSMEGIVRQTWKQDPTTDIVFTYTITTPMTNDYCRGLCNRSASAMEQLADHYGIPSINFGPRVADLLKQGKLIMSAHELNRKFDPYTVEQDKNGTDEKGRIVFAPEGVHPYDKGHELYLASIINGFTQMKDSAPVNHKAKLDTPFVANNFETAKMVAIEESMLSGTWQKLPADNSLMKSFSNRQGQIWQTDTPGSTLTFTFNGTYAQIYDLLGPNGGQVDIFVDGVKVNKKPCARFDSYCTYWRIATMWCCSFPEVGTHTVKIVLDEGQPDRHPVAFRLKDPEAEFKTPKYNGRNFWASQLMIIGEIVR
ncbi:MAG: SGNH/GDSL hydrolase family protein [Kiritimatiellae bacterium]|nr:SGNH/GDSL hydrolase family protein [Kiritimatiellia bacterium]